MSEISRNSTGLSGEYFVAAELYRKGWSVGMTIGNAKSIDLFAEKDEKVILLQVKSIYKGKNNGWPIKRDQIRNDCIYIFVNLNGDKMTEPDYYISTSEEAIVLVRLYKTRGIITLKSVKNENFKNKWEKLNVV